MKTLTYLFLLMSYIAISGCSTSTIISSSKWDSKSEEVLDSIPLTQYQYDNKSKLFYHIYNNSQYIYLLLKIDDELVQRKIMRMGLTVWIDPSAQKKKNYGIKFPIGGGVGRSGAEHPKFDRKTPPATLLIPESEMLLIGLGDGVGSEQLVSATNPNYIHVKVTRDNFNVLNYKLVIPLKLLSSREKFADGKFFSLGIETGESERPERMSEGRGYRPGDMEPNDGMGGRGMGPGMGGRAGMGRRSSGEHPDFQEMASPVKLWLKKVQLAE